MAERCSKERETGAYASRCRRGGLLRVLLVVTLDSTSRVNELLATGKKRVTVRTDFYSQIACGRTSHERVTANACYHGLLVFRMNPFSHDKRLPF